MFSTELFFLRHASFYGNHTFKGYKWKVHQINNSWCCALLNFPTFPFCCPTSITWLECDKCLRDLKLIKQEEHKFLSHLFAPCFGVQEDIYSPLSPCHIWAYKKKTDLFHCFCERANHCRGPSLTLISTCSLHRDIMKIQEWFLHTFSLLYMQEEG